jgi:hypothetical protein
MPRYFFNVHDGASTIDEYGSEFPNVSAAKHAATAFAGEMLRDRRDALTDGESWKLDVTSDTGLVLFSLFIGSVDAPAIRNDLSKFLPSNPPG